MILSGLISIIVFGIMLYPLIDLLVDSPDYKKSNSSSKKPVFQKELISAAMAELNSIDELIGLDKNLELISVTSPKKPIKPIINKIDVKTGKTPLKTEQSDYERLLLKEKWIKNNPPGVSCLMCSKLGIHTHYIMEARQ